MRRQSIQKINRVIYIESNFKGVELFKEKDYAYLFILSLFHLSIKRLIDKPHRKIWILNQGKGPTRKVHVLTAKC